MLDEPPLLARRRVPVVQALADAHVKEDQASLLLSTDAQALEHLKGQMSLEVMTLALRSDLISLFP